MHLLQIDNWQLFNIFFSLMLIVTFKMQRQSEAFYTKDVVRRKFSIMELEIPATHQELVNLIHGLYLLSTEESEKSIKALKGQLQLDFLFMPFAYGSLFLLCMRTAAKMDTQVGRVVFTFFAFLQFVCWICDITENIYLLRKINQGRREPPKLSEQEQSAMSRRHKWYLFMEFIKWGGSLTSLICAASVICYFWLTGNYSHESFLYFLLVIAEIFIFMVVSKSTKAPAQSI